LFKGCFWRLCHIRRPTVLPSYGKAVREANTRMPHTRTLRIGVDLGLAELQLISV
jgi:hypothetical protein